MTTYVLTFPQPAPLLNLNSRLHWSTRSEYTREWRAAARWAAINAKLGQLPPCIVTVTVPVKDRRRRDPSNVYVTKPIVDGLVDAGCWSDDTSEWVSTTEPVLEVGALVVVVRMVER